MKTLRLIPILLLSAGMFTACHKQDATTTAPAPDPAYQQINTGYVYNSQIVYQLAVHKSDGSSILVWDGGYLHISNILFNPIYTSANSGTLNMGKSKAEDNRFGQPMDITMNLFGPTVLASVKMPELSSTMANVTIQTSPKGAAMSMVLNGRFNFAPDMPPYPPHHVQFTVSTPLDLTTNWVQKASITSSGVLAAMDMDLSLLANGIGYTMMNNATLTGDTIYISATQNTNIYNIMLANLKSMQLGLTLTPGSTASPNM